MHWAARFRSGFRAMSAECLRIVGNSGYLSDEETEEKELKEFMNTEMREAYHHIRSMVLKESDQVTGFNILGMFACGLPAAQVPEVRVPPLVLDWVSVDQLVSLRVFIPPMLSTTMYFHYPHNAVSSLVCALDV
jgi:hypothetical protein